LETTQAPEKFPGLFFVWMRGFRRQKPFTGAIGKRKKAGASAPAFIFLT
jgi:hypothetical protein